MHHGEGVNTWEEQTLTLIPAWFFMIWDEDKIIVKWWPLTWRSTRLRPCGLLMDNCLKICCIWWETVDNPLGKVVTVLQILVKVLKKLGWCFPCFKHKLKMSWEPLCKVSSLYKVYFVSSNKQRRLFLVISDISLPCLLHLSFLFLSFPCSVS